MQPSPTTASTAIPGMRISNYRNSARRAIRLIGIGAVASELVSRIGQRSLPNVAITSRSAAIDRSAIAGDAADRDLNMIVIVCHEGDTRLFRPVGGRPDVLVTFVLLQSESYLLAQHGPELRPDVEPDLERARAFSDLFVSTSDPDYVSELIDNLAS
jgi:hypothetical protein